MYGKMGSNVCSVQGKDLKLYSYKKKVRQKVFVWRFSLCIAILNVKQSTLLQQENFKLQLINNFFVIQYITVATKFILEQTFIAFLVNELVILFLLNYC